MAQILKTTAKQLFHHVGGLHLVRWKNRNAVRILMYHRFADQASLQAQCIYLRQHYRMLSMRRLSEWLQSERPVPANSAVVTIDDGYRDFLKVAFPIFLKYSIPVTVFLVTDFLDGKLWLWPDIVKYAFEHTPLTNVEIDIPQARLLSFSLSSSDLRLRASHLIIEQAKTLKNHDRLLLMDRLIKRLGVKLPPEMPEHCKPLCWEEVRTLAQAGVEFGAHTRTHPILSRISDDQELHDEIAGSKSRIEEALDAAVLHFCYPNGRAADIGSSAVSAVRAADFRTAVTTERGLNLKSSDRFLLRRIGVEPNLPDLYFRQCVAGFRV
jgi:peptidoglycan/xylan/chitin deacetylase (PgdA/CDA1 family)